MVFITIVFTFFKIMSHYKMTGGEEVSMRCHNLDYMSMIKDVIFFSAITCLICTMLTAYCHLRMRRVRRQGVSRVRMKNGRGGWKEYNEQERGDG